MRLGGKAPSLQERWRDTIPEVLEMKFLKLVCVSDLKLQLIPFLRNPWFSEHEKAFSFLV